MKEKKETEAKTNPEPVARFFDWPDGASEFLGCFLPYPGVQGRWWDSTRAPLLASWWQCPSLALSVGDILTKDGAKRLRRALATILVADESGRRQRKEPRSTEPTIGQRSRATELADRWDQARRKAEYRYRDNVRVQDILFSWKTLFGALESGLLPAWLRFPPALIPPEGYAEVLTQRKTNAERERAAEELGRWMADAKSAAAGDGGANG